MFKRIEEHPTNETLQSYVGLLRHGNTFHVREELLNWYGLHALMETYNVKDDGR